MRGEDEVNFFVRANTLDTILFFTDKGKVYSERVFELPEESRQGRGIPLVNIINLEPEETVTAVLPVESFSQAKYCAMATRLGRVKRVPMSDFENVRPSGLIAIRLNDGDELGWVRMTSSKDDLLMVTRQGKALRFSESEVRPTGRTTMGVTGIHLRGDDRVVSMDVVETDGYLLVITDKGQGKRTPLDEYLAKSRGTLGVTTISQEARAEIGDIAQAMVVLEDEDITTITRSGIVLRTKVSDISIQGRATQGVRVMDIDEGDSLAAVVRISSEEVETAAKAREQALAEESEESQVILTETDETDIQEEQSSVDEDDVEDEIIDDAENSAE
jgi:DNA gyrase subunit A